jgi:lipopolysaccharide transport system ATP-binding protein
VSQITARDVVVDFPIYDAGHRSLKTQLLSSATGGRIARDASNHVTVRALDNVSFSIRAGDRVGLVGHNGAGKTTLLRVLSGIYEPVGGSLIVDGRVATLLDINLGIDAEATGYENIRMRALMMGLHPSAIEPKIDDIARFTELGDYLDMPLRTYSSGMRLRLAFAVSTSVDADILLMDEWLGVGDADFQPKAKQRMEELVARTKILVVASHDYNLLRSVCNRVLRLAHGKIEEVPVQSLN